MPLLLGELPHPWPKVGGGVLAQPAVNACIVAYHTQTETHVYVYVHNKYNIHMHTRAFADVCIYYESQVVPDRKSPPAPPGSSLAPRSWMPWAF